jgi:hypothetical protein
LTSTGNINYGPSNTLSNVNSVGIWTSNTSVSASNRAYSSLLLSGGNLTGAVTGTSINMNNLTINSNINLPNNSVISSFNTGTWINFLSNTPSGIGNSGVGVTPWIAFASSNSSWVSNSITKDICFVTESNARMLFASGGTGNTSDITLSNKNISISSPVNVNNTMTLPTTSLTIAGENLVFGRNYRYANAIASTTTGATAFATKITLTDTFEAGTYLIQSYCEIQSGTAARYGEVQISVDGTPVNNSHVYFGGTSQFSGTFTNIHKTLTAGTHTILHSFRRATYSGTATIACRNANLYLYRVL